MFKDYLNKIISGDCLEVMERLPEDSINLILTDPPYNVSGKTLELPNNTTGGPWYKMSEEWDKFENYKEYLDFTRRWLARANKLLVKNGSIMICCSYHGLGEILIALKELEYKILNIIVWEKTNPMPNITKRTFTHSTEFVVWAAKSSGWIFNYMTMKKYANGKQLRDVWKFSLCQGGERIKDETGRAAHPTQKPLELFKRLVEAASKEEDVILDPFIGSGTTALAAINLKRKWIGIENNAKYVNIANKRIHNFQSHKI